MYQKIGILVVLASVLLSAALLVTPTFKVANAQLNQTKGIDVDKWITTLKENNPALAALEDQCKTADPMKAECDVKDAVGKIIVMKDAKEAVKTLGALRLFHELMDFKATQEAQ